MGVDLLVVKKNQPKKGSRAKGQRGKPVANPQDLLCFYLLDNGEGGWVKECVTSNNMGV